jgi:Helicase associated domain
MSAEAQLQEVQEAPNDTQQHFQYQDQESDHDLKRRRPSISGSQQESEGQQDENNDPGDEYQPLKRRRKVEPRGVPWFVMLERLKSYKERYGSLNVPSTYRQDPKLASWVQYQRYLFHHKEIPEERKQALDEIGFEWSILKPKSGGKKRTWDEQLALVKAYKDENGHTLIPYSHQEDPSLGFWVSKQVSFTNGLIIALLGWVVAKSFIYPLSAWCQMNSFNRERISSMGSSRRIRCHWVHLEAPHWAATGFQEEKVRGK